MSNQSHLSESSSNSVSFSQHIQLQRMTSSCCARLQISKAGLKDSEPNSGASHKVSNLFCFVFICFLGDQIITNQKWVKKIT